MPSPRCPGSLTAVALFACALALPTVARGDNIDWINNSGGSVLTPTNWFDTHNSLFQVPGINDNVIFDLTSAYNVSWSAPVDTVFSLSVTGGAPRFNINNPLYVIGFQTYVNSDSLTLLSGTLVPTALIIGNSASAALLGTGASLISCSDSTKGSLFGDGYPTHVTFNGGGRFQTDGWIEMAHSVGDVETTSVAGRSLSPSVTSGITTTSALGGGYHGDLIVGTNGSGVLQLFNGGYANIAGDLFVGKGGLSSGLVHLYVTGIGLPNLTVHGQTVIGNTDPASYAVGGGLILAERGSVNLDGPALVQNGGITIRNGASMTATSVDIDPTPNDTQYAILQVHGSGTQTTIIGDLEIGAGAMSPNGISAVLLADSSATLNCTGSNPVLIDPNGEISVSGGATFQSTAELDVSGYLFVSSSFHAPLIHMRYGGGGGEFDASGTVNARLLMDANTTFRPAQSGALTIIGDSTATDGFVSSGFTGMASDTLVVLDKGVAELGTVWLGGGVIRVASGGHVANSQDLNAPGRYVGDVTNDGTLSAYSPNTLEIDGHVTQLTGIAIGDGTLSIPFGSEMTAHGSIAPLLLLGGILDFGPSPSALSIGHGFTAAGTADCRFRIGSRSSGVQDAMFVTGAAALGGALKVFPVSGNIPNTGDTLTIITSTSLSGTFSSITYNGGNASTAIKVLYGPTTVKIVVLDGLVAVGGGPAGLPLRFASAGTLSQPAMELDLPDASTVKVDLFDVAGRQVAVLADGSLPAGRNPLPLGRSPLASGVYFGRAVVAGGGGSRSLVARVVIAR